MTKTYEDGVRDGRIAALEEIAAKHEYRLNSHEKEMKQITRSNMKIIYTFGGVILAIEILPLVFDMFGK